MKLLRLKITDKKFRSLQSGFEHVFRSEWDLQEEQETKHDFAPFICAGPNGSGKSNLLEVLAAIFYHMECINLENLPDSFRYDEETNSKGFRGEKATPDGFEIEYLIQRPQESLEVKDPNGMAHVRIVKEVDKAPQWYFLNHAKVDEPMKMVNSRSSAKELLPDYIIGYSSGENEILSLPFFKMRFVQYDEYRQALQQQLPYPGRPESRLVYLDSGFSQAILLCNLLFQDAETLKPFRDDVKIEELKEFRIIIQRSIEIDQDQIASFDNSEKHDPLDIDKIIDSHPYLYEPFEEEGPRRFFLDIVKLLDGEEKTGKIIPRLKRCATCWFLDEATDTLYLDYSVNDATKEAFRSNFANSPIELFQAFQVLLTLNLHTVSGTLKSDLYQSDSLYVGETVPVLASDQRIMRFKFLKFRKTDVAEPVMLRNLSDGEHQLLHSLGLCLLFRNTNSLFLLDEPETHFNPDWRANFATRLHQCFEGSKGDHEMLVTTHTPFLISDSRPEKVLVFKKDNDGSVSISNPEYNTLGASINKITMATFGKRETIGGHAQTMLEDFRLRFEAGEDKEQLMEAINHQLGDSVEKILLIKSILASMKGQD
jgi:restriction system-associated AAA family ATPase